MPIDAHMSDVKTSLDQTYEHQAVICRYYTDAVTKYVKFV